MEQETVKILYNTLEDHMLQMILSIIIFINRYNCLWVVSSSFTVRVKFSRVELSYPVTGEQLLLLPLSLSLISLSLQGEDVSFHALTHILVLSHLTSPPSANEGNERRRGDRREVIGQKGREGVERGREGEREREREERGTARVGFIGSVTGVESCLK
jgi:hypothetical protein